MELPKSDKEIIRLIARGDEQVFEQLFRLWYARLTMFGYKFLGDRQEAENIVQMVFIKFWEKRKELKINSLKGYLMAAVRNGCINELKRGHHHLSVEDQFNIAVSTEEDDFDEELMKKVNEAINEMPPQRQRIFKMGRFDGLKYREIASRLGISHKTVEVQMGKALKTLRETFNPQCLKERKIVK
ncbi:RNA polymerase sigma-70 factor [Marinilabilia rubra]|uniref:RNA polymerase sigma-70 factor n=1 Tax=Marinilabilia rubra TaxID=2162893 RepID=A0A2U2B6K5_9BACT|nr:RNA polymerase sigma-70 factor [Marinilabilia rubra]PWD98664.1 RNA polymerase sigma-70 factor [Marinilabilia rubra]